MSDDQADEMVSTSDFTEEILPGGIVHKAESTGVVLRVDVVRTSHLRMIPKNGQEQTLILKKNETILRLPASEDDIPSIVALVASNAARRRKNERDRQRRKGKP